MSTKPNSLTSVHLLIKASLNNYLYREVDKPTPSSYRSASSTLPIFIDQISLIAPPYSSVLIFLSSSLLLGSTPPTPRSSSSAPPYSSYTLVPPFSSLLLLHPSSSLLLPTPLTPPQYISLARRRDAPFLLSSAIETLPSSHLYVRDPLGSVLSIISSAISTSLHSENINRDLAQVVRTDMVSTQYTIFEIGTYSYCQICKKKSKEFHHLT